MRILVLLLSLLSTPVMGDGVEFRFHTTKSGNPPVEFGGTGWIQGGDFRMELDRGNHPFFHTGALLIHQNRGAVIVVLDRTERTYFMRTTERMRGTVSTMNAPWQVEARDVSVRLRPQPERETIAGQPTRRHLLEISYTIWMLVEDTAMKARVRARGDLWLSDIDHRGAVPYGFHYGLKTGFPEVDRRVSRALAGKGLPLRQIVSAARSIDGAPEVTETMTTEVVSLQQGNVPAGMFRVGSEYRYAEPSVTLPERSE